MNQYISFTFKGLSQEQAEILIAQLEDYSVAGFEENEGLLKAYFDQENVNDELTLFIQSLPYEFDKEVIASQNWNALWESNFSPVVVDDFVAVRAHFHEPITNVQHELVITPKMSFGTGHHATTYMMLSQMRNIDFKNKAVFDFGTGTGVLALLAEKLGADFIYANDIDDWSIENAQENAANNNCTNVKIVKANTAVTNEKFDVVLANINRNVLLDNMAVLSNELVVGGTLLMSGLLESDFEIINEAAAKEGLQLKDKSSRNGWICLRFSK